MNSPTLPLLAIALLALTPLSAQFSQLAATDDGKQLYFTSQLLLLGAPPPDWPFGETRIYLAGPGGVSLFAERGSLASCCTSSDGASLPQVSGDGSVIGFILYDICFPSTDCDLDSIYDEAQIRGKQNLDLGQGEVQLSRNGRWALLTLGPYDPSSYGQSTLVDLPTGQRITVPPTPTYIYFQAQAYHTIASDGSMLVQVPGLGPLLSAVGVWKQGQFTPVALSPQVISDDASTLIYTGVEYGDHGFIQSRIVAISVATGKQVTLYQSKDQTQDPFFLGLSNDGRVLLYHLGYPAGPAYIADTQTGKSTAINLPAGEFAVDGTLTGAGDIAFLATNAGRILKLDVARQTFEALFPAVPHCDDPGPLAQGSLASLHCTVQGTVPELQGVFRMDDIPMPVLSATGGEIEVQVPWEMIGFYSDTLTINAPNASPFQAAQALDVSFMIPQFQFADPNSGALLGLKLIKGDWSGLLTEQPSPGDIFYAYMTGLGAVNGPMQTGVAASLTTPEPILGSLVCSFGPSGPAETIFAGLAPGTIGIDQVAFRIPPDAGPNPIQGVACSWSSPFGEAGSFGGLSAPASGTRKRMTQFKAKSRVDPNRRLMESQAISHGLFRWLWNR